VHEVPLPQWPLLALDDKQSLAGEHEEVFLIGFPVVHRHGLPRREHKEAHPELPKVPPTLEGRVNALALAIEPARLARVEDEPSPAGRHEPRLGLFERCLRDHGRRLQRRTRLASKETRPVVLALAGEHPVQRVVGVGDEAVEGGRRVVLSEAYV